MIKGGTNMARNKVIFGEEVLIDLTSDTVTADKLLTGYTAHDAAGNLITGELDVSRTSVTPTPGDTVVKAVLTSIEAKTSSTVSATGIKMVISIPGIYRLKTIAHNSYSASSSSGYNSHVQFYKNGTAIGTATEISATSTVAVEEDIECAANDEIEIYASSADSSYITTCNGLFACIDWDNGF